MQIELKQIKRGRKFFNVRVVFDGSSYTVYDMSRKVMKTKKYFSMTDVEKDYKFVDNV